MEFASLEQHNVESLLQKIESELMESLMETLDDLKTSKLCAFLDIKEDH
jgi:hypothetical protein